MAFKTKGLPQNKTLSLVNYPRDQPEDGLLYLHFYERKTVFYIRFWRRKYRTIIQPHKHFLKVFLK